MFRSLMIAALLSLALGCGHTGPGSSNDEPFLGSSGCRPPQTCPSQPRAKVTVSTFVRNSRGVPMSFWLNIAKKENETWTTLAHSEHPPIAPGEVVPYSPMEVEGGAELLLAVRAREEGIFFDQKGLRVERGTTGTLRAVFQITDEGLSAQWE